MDLKHIGPIDDRVAVVYGGAFPWSIGAIVCGSLAFIDLIRSIQRPLKAMDWSFLFVGLVLLFISWGWFTCELVLPVLRRLAGAS